ncbi:RdgB/HAM1 family non-canonical purine NTP pyrophosphatase [Hydromonas duriensis]|uniref:dITP/XTP pyrophosphatase n=1 Tax=Hydromonas duriensis TaxID=1527608 RepID=A0A4R6YB25_9BURK|nr:RdgB/HAM1 family non-canonical purine NTP pyrophosphatase [Hydromonas duriensis]TDR32824.1 XTP/dITP diphosphohydrolase [Hydromonas duriensis]
MSQLVLASNNSGKLLEFNRLLAPLHIEVQAQAALNVPECEEPYFTFVENALHKARHAARITGLPALADDSGVCVPALNGAPGVLSARYAGEDKDSNLPKDVRNNLKLTAALADKLDKRAYFYCVIVLVRHAQDPQPIIVDGQLWGEMIDNPRGDSGFGYDPYFYLPHLNKTLAELSHNEKNAISHRGLAVEKLIEILHKEHIS